MLHETAVSYIFNELEQNFEGDCIVITHHVPYVRNKRDDLAPAYQSDLTKRFSECKNLPWFWISGHTHISEVIPIEYETGIVTFISNQLGYPNEQTNFNENLVLEIGELEVGK